MNLVGTKNPIIIATTLAIIPYEKSKNTGPPEIKKNMNICILNHKGGGIIIYCAKIPYKIDNPGASGTS